MIYNIQFKITLGKINKIPKLYTIFALKMPDYIIRQRDRGQAEAKASRPRPNLWGRGQNLGLEATFCSHLSTASPLCKQVVCLNGISLHAPVTFGKAWNCPAYYTWVYFSSSPVTICQKSACALYTGAHYNRDITVFVSCIHWQWQHLTGLRLSHLMLLFTGIQLVFTCVHWPEKLKLLKIFSLINRCYLLFVAWRLMLQKIKCAEMK